MKMLYILQHLIAMCSIKVSYNRVLMSYLQLTHVRVDEFMPQGQYHSRSTRTRVQDQSAEHYLRSNNADGAIVHNFLGDDVTRRNPGSPCTINQHVVLPSRHTPFRDNTSPNNTWLAADFSHFGEASASLFQVANFSQFGGPYTEVVQPADFSDFGNASTVIFPSSVWSVDGT
jgi:hypothetical protein